VLPRFFAPEASASGTDQVIELPDDEAAHSSRVLRLAPGAAVRVFDGKGLEWQGEVAESSKRRVTVRLVRPVTAASEPRVKVSLAMAVLKGEKMEDVVRDAVMLGVTDIQPMVTERTEISLSALRKGERAPRWQRIAVASAKQCGRAVVPAVREPEGFEQLLAPRANEARWMLVEPDADGGDRAHQADTLEAPPSVRLFVGPEGGWTSEEVARAIDAGCQLVSLGTRTLRADAVPLVALAAFRALWKDL
jgi:16S rRNA (uracil1498-N3)-methyltransferase